jgi:uncharacterized coiled-coil DUF342 family protein
MKERSNRALIQNIVELAQLIEWRADAATIDQHAFDLFSDSEELRKIEDDLQTLADKIEDEVNNPQ